MVVQSDPDNSTKNMWNFLACRKMVEWGWEAWVCGQLRVTSHQAIPDTLKALQLKVGKLSKKPSDSVTIEI